MPVIAKAASGALAVAAWGPKGDAACPTAPPVELESDEGPAAGWKGEAAAHRLPTCPPNGGVGAGVLLPALGPPNGEGFRVWLPPPKGDVDVGLAPLLLPPSPPPPPPKGEFCLAPKGETCCKAPKGDGPTLPNGPPPPPPPPPLPPPPLKGDGVMVVVVVPPPNGAGEVLWAPGPPWKGEADRGTVVSNGSVVPPATLLPNGEACTLPPNDAPNGLLAAPPNADWPAFAKGDGPPPPPALPPEAAAKGFDTTAPPAAKGFETCGACQPPPP